MKVFGAPFFMLSMFATIYFAIALTKSDPTDQIVYEERKAIEK